MHVHGSLDVANLPDLCVAGQTDTLSALVLHRMISPSLGYSRQDALEWMLDVARALQYLHSLEPLVIHRDM